MNINLYENKSGHYEHIYFIIKLYENKPGHYKYIYFNIKLTTLMVIGTDCLGCCFQATIRSRLYLMIYDGLYATMYFQVIVRRKKKKSNKKCLKIPKWVIKIRKSMKSRRHNDQKKKDKRTNNDLPNIHIKLKIEKHEPH